MSKTNNLFLTSLLVLSVLFFASCKSNSDQQRNVTLLPDSASFYNNRVQSDTPLVAPQQANNSSERALRNSANRNAVNRTSATRNTSSSGVYGPNSTARTSSRKKGWSKGAKGAVIGGASGAVAGAIISKKKGTGALIGAAVGAAGGYIIGRQQDKKDGRIRR